MIRNDSKEAMDAEVEVEFFDAEGDSLGKGYSSVKNIQPGADAKWTTELLETEERAASCKIVDISTYKVR
jgi:hypothetical protein